MLLKHPWNVIQGAECWTTLITVEFRKWSEREEEEEKKEEEEEEEEEEDEENVREERERKYKQTGLHTKGRTHSTSLICH